MSAFGWKPMHISVIKPQCLALIVCHMVPSCHSETMDLVLYLKLELVDLIIDCEIAIKFRDATAISFTCDILKKWKEMP